MATKNLHTNSSAIASASYDPDTETLTLSFVKGGSHSYDGVPEPIVRAFMESGSKGKYFNAVIRPLY